jgi:hypothetical protein
VRNGDLRLLSAGITRNIHLEAENGALRELVEQLQSRVGELQERIVELQERIVELQERVVEVERKIGRSCRSTPWLARMTPWVEPAAMPGSSRDHQSVSTSRHGRSASSRVKYAVQSPTRSRPAPRARCQFVPVIGSVRPGSSVSRLV